MSGHTPGPWHVCGEDEASHRWVIAQADGSSVADCSPVGPWVPDETADTNARLIAAAPELLEALRRLTELAIGPAGGVTQTDKRDAIDMACAAIAKAAGEQS